MHRRQKKPYAVIFAVVLAVVVFGALRDMHRLNNPPPEPVVALRFHFADDAGDFARLPRDTSPVMIHIGGIKKQEEENGETYTLVHTDIEPVTLPQREVNLLVTLHDLPVSVSHFSTLIEQEVTRWKRKNNKIAEILLEWQTDTPDIEKLGIFAAGLRAHLKLDYWIGLGLRRGWFEADPAQAEWLLTRPDGIRSYVYSIDEAQQDNETLEQTLAALDKIGIPFLVKTRRLPPARQGVSLREAYPLFGGFVAVY